MTNGIPLKKLVRNTGKNYTLPATVVSVVGGKCSVTLARNGQRLDGLSYSGNLAAGQRCLVDFSSGTPVALGYGGEVEGSQAARRTTTRTGAFRDRSAGSEESASNAETAIVLYSGGSSTSYPISEDGLTDALAAAASGDIVSLPDCDLTTNPLVEAGITLIGISAARSKINGTLTLQGSNARVQAINITDVGTDATRAVALRIQGDGVGCAGFAVECNLVASNDYGDAAAVECAETSLETQAALTRCYLEAEAGASYAAVCVRSVSGSTGALAILECNLDSGAGLVTPPANFDLLDMQGAKAYLAENYGDPGSVWPAASSQVVYLPGDRAEAGHTHAGESGAAVVSKTADYAPDGTQDEFILVDATTASVQITLPSPVANRTYWVYRVDAMDTDMTEVVIVSLADPVYGNTTLYHQAACLKVICDGTAWYTYIVDEQHQHVFGGDMTKAVYDPDDDGQVTPEEHASTHASGGTDAVKLDDLATPDDNTDLNASASAHGLLPKLSGNTTDVLKGNGTWGTVGSTLVDGYLKWDPLAPPATAGTYDDEFDNNSLAAMWTEFDPDSVLTVSEDDTGLVLTASGASAIRIAGVRATVPAGDWSIITRVSVSQNLASSVSAGLALWEDAADTAKAIYTLYNFTSASYNGWRVSKYTNYSTLSSNLKSEIGSIVTPNHFWLRIRAQVISGATHCWFDLGKDGEGWLMGKSVEPLVFNPLHWGVFINNETSATAAARFDFFRYINSKQNVYDPCYGRRVKMGIY